MKLTVATVKQFTLVGQSKQSLKQRSEDYRRSVKNCDCEKNEIANTVGKQITTLAGIRKNVSMGKAD